MNKYFLHYSSPKPPFFNRNLLIMLTIVLGVLLVFSSLLEIKGSRDELLHVYKEQSTALITALDKGSHNAIQSFDLVEEMLAERLLSNARFIEELDYNNNLDREMLLKITNENNIFRANVFDAVGNRVFSNAPGSGLGMGRGFGQQQGPRRFSPESIIEMMKNDNNDELVMGFGQRRFGAGQRFAVSKKRRKGGVIILNIDANEMTTFRKTIGAGKLMQDIGGNEGIVYVALQDSAHILLASQGVDSLETFENDDFLLNAQSASGPFTRMTSYKNTRVFEVVKRTEIDENNMGLLRVGLSTQHLQEAESNAQTRIILGSVIVLIISIVIVNWLIGNLNYSSLQKAYERIETYTGSILANMTDALVAIDGSGKINVVNKSAEKLFKISASKTLGQNCSDVLDVLCPLLQSSLDNGIGIFKPEMALQVDEKEYVVSTSVTVLKDPNGKIDTVFAVVKDLTEQKKMQENLNRQDQITAMGHLASGVAHEIRNPLNAISIISQRFKQEFSPTEDKAEYDELTTTMVNQTIRINEIVQQFLKLARPGALDKKPTNLRKVLQDIITLAKAQAAEKNIDISFICEKGPFVIADSDKLQQVFLNILQNSLDACDKKGHISLSCEKQGGNVCICVKDDGYGMDEETRKKIFNMYFTTKQKGTGLGLSIVQQIISLHNGTIDVQSLKGQGTTFTVLLPILEK